MKNNNTKYIFVVGGVLSGVGKGIIAASIGNILSAKGFNVFSQKLDPYLNTDPGTMSPYQHGEVYVTQDGAETDLDLGHYERFIGNKLTTNSSWTQGRILWELLKEERQGVYGGATVQSIPHLTDKIQSKIIEAGESSKADFVIVEVGGTVGDIESQPFIHAIARQMANNMDNTFLASVVYVPYLRASQEYKTKPTQHAISSMMSYGLKPDMIFLRSETPVDEGVSAKIWKNANMEKEMVVNVPDVSSVYGIPLTLAENKVIERILKSLNIEDRKTNNSKWKEFVELSTTKHENTFEIAMVGKYVEYEDAYKSIIEAIKISGSWNKVNINLKWIQAENINDSNVAEKIGNVDGLIILPGFGERGFEGKVSTARYAMEKDLPTLGICYGFQAMVVGHARNKGHEDATSSEVSKEGRAFIDIIQGTDRDAELGGTLRLGESKTIHKEGTLVEQLYGESFSIERHRHRYEANPEFMPLVVDDEFVLSGHDETTGLAEVCEMPNKQFFIGVQAHPEFNATPLKPHPLFEGLIKAMKK